MPAESETPIFENLSAVALLPFRVNSAWLVLVGALAGFLFFRLHSISF